VPLHTPQTGQTKQNNTKGRPFRQLIKGAPGGARRLTREENPLVQDLEEELTTLARREERNGQKSQKGDCSLTD